MIKKNRLFVRFNIRDGENNRMASEQIMQRFIKKTDCRMVVRKPCLLRHKTYRKKSKGINKHEI